MLQLTTRFTNARGIFLVQQVPLAFRNKPSDFLALRRHWIAGESKGNDLDMTRLGFLAMNVAALEAARVPGAFAELGLWRGNSAKVSLARTICECGQEDVDDRHKAVMTVNRLAGALR
jgi:hypothetical protein